MPQKTRTCQLRRNCMRHFLILLTLLSFTAFADDALWKKLQQEPYMIAVMRNTESSGNGTGASMLTWDSSGNCIGESTLTPQGKAHAMRVGEAFAKRGIKPFVISSPMCRCRETARIAFGTFVADPDLRQRPPDDTQGQEAFHAIASTLLTEHRGKTPVVFVNHRPNIDALTMELINIGELLVGTITEDGDIDVLGKLRPEQ